MKAYPEVEPGPDQESPCTLPPAVETTEVVDPVVPGWDDFAPPTTNQAPTDAIAMTNNADAPSEPNGDESQIFQDLQDEDKSTQSKFIWASLMVEQLKAEGLCEILLPATMVKDWYRTNLKFTTVNSNVASYFQIKVIIEDARAMKFKPPLHTASLEWYLGGMFQNPDQITRISLCQSTNKETGETHFNARWSSTSTMSHGLDISLDSFTEETQSILTVLCQY